MGRLHPTLTTFSTQYSALATDRKWHLPTPDAPWNPPLSHRLTISPTQWHFLTISPRKWYIFTISPIKWYILLFAKCPCLSVLQLLSILSIFRQIRDFHPQWTYFTILRMGSFADKGYGGHLDNPPSPLPWPPDRRHYLHSWLGLGGDWVCQHWETIGVWVDGEDPCPAGEVSQTIPIIQSWWAPHGVEEGGGN